MRNKNISTQSNRLLTYFNSLEIRCFDYSEAYKAMPDTKLGTVRELLSDMTKRGVFNNPAIGDCFNKSVLRALF